MNITEDIAAHLVRTKFESIDKAAVERAKWRIIDAIGVLLAGVHGPLSGSLVELVKKWGGAEESSILIYGGKTTAQQAAFINSIVMRSFDFEPIDAEGEVKPSPAHISGTTIPAAIAAAEKVGAGGKDLLTALILGDDLAARLGTASIYGFDKPNLWDNTGTINGFGATAVAGKLLGLDEKQMRNALGLIIHQISGSLDTVWDKTHAFKLPISMQARNGIFSAELAQIAFTGNIDPLTGKIGYFALFCGDSDLNALMKDLGKRYYADCVIKPYSSCRGTHAPIDCAMKIAGQDGYDVNDIEEINIYLPPFRVKGFVGQPFMIGEVPQINGAFSIRYTVASALLRKRVYPEDFSDESIRDPRIAGLIAKMNLIAKGPEELSTIAEMQVKMKNGTILSADAGKVALGDIFRNPLTEEQILAKYRYNVAFSKTISEENAEIVLSMLQNLEDLDDIRELTRLLIA